MSIKSIRIKNVMAFGCKNNNNIHNAFELNFNDGINVIIGENGTGKTSLLKMIYAAIEAPSQINDTKTLSYNLYDYFSNKLKVNNFSNIHMPSNSFVGFEVSNGNEVFKANFSDDNIHSFYTKNNWNTSAIFIPTTEMLSHSKGFLALNQKFNMPFDQTQIDIIVNASLPEARQVPKYMNNILDKISKVIDGSIIQENDEFYVLKNNGQKIPFSLEAEGLRKLGLLWKLIRNGLLVENCVLIWDEPEANLNPELFPLVTEILLELQQNGIQIFIATHSYNFAKYLEIRRTSKEQVQFHNLYHADEIGIDNDSAYFMGDLKQNHIMIADNKLLDEVYNL